MKKKKDDSATLGQGNQLINLILQKKVQVDQLQKIIDSGLFADLLDAQNIEKVDRNVFRKLLGLSSLRFVDEELSSNCGYFSGYLRPNPILQQVNVIRRVFHNLGDHFVNESITSGPLFSGAEGYFAIPRWQSIASTYHEACEIALFHLGKAYEGYLRNEIDINEAHLRRSKRTEDALQKVYGEQKSDILILQGQLGFLHRGRSVRRAIEVMADNEFGLGIFETVVMLLTHSNRLKHSDDLWIDCAGDEYSDDGSDFGSAPHFSFRGGKLELSAGWQSGADGRFGSVSVFFPQ